MLGFLEELAKRGLLELGAARAGATEPAQGPTAEDKAPADHPYTLIAELTYRCPLRCPYCSNPVELAREAAELTTDDWRRVFGEAAALGVMQVHLTGGEPLARRDLEALVARAREVGLYTNLITSGVPLTRERLAALAAGGGRSRAAQRAGRGRRGRGPRGRLRRRSRTSSRSPRG